MYNVCQNLYKNCILYCLIIEVKKLSLHCDWIYFKVLSIHFSSGHQDKQHSMMNFILAVGVVFILFFNSIVIPLQCLSHPNLHFIWKKSRKWNEIFEAKWIKLIYWIYNCQMMIDTMLYFLWIIIYSHYSYEYSPFILL